MALELDLRYRPTTELELNQFGKLFPRKPPRVVFKRTVLGEPGILLLTYAAGYHDENPQPTPTDSPGDALRA